MEQLAARWAHNPKVVGSSPAPATKQSLKNLIIKMLSGFLFYCGTHVLHIAVGFGSLRNLFAIYLIP